MEKITQPMCLDVLTMRFFNDQGTSVPVYVTVNNSIELSGNTTVNVLTDHVAGNEILLKPGVTVESYTARIGACEKASCATSLPSFRGSGQQEANATILEPIVLSTEVVDLLGHKVFEKSGQLEMRELNQLKSGVYIIREKNFFRNRIQKRICSVSNNAFCLKKLTVLQTATRCESSGHFWN